MEKLGIETRLANLEATRVAFMLVLTSIIATHPNYHQMQMHLTSLLEQQLAGGALGSTLTPAQSEYAREVVEWMQQIHSKVAPDPQKSP